MSTPPEIKAAISISWVVEASKTVDRLWRISNDPDASTFVHLGSNLKAATLLSAVLVGVFLFFATRRHNWARVSLLVSTCGGWCLWLVWLIVFKAGSEYSLWHWLVPGCIVAMELIAMVLLFRGKGAAWYQAPHLNQGPL